MNQDNNIKHFRGYWKFKDSYVSLDELHDLAAEWAADEKYVSLIIRQTSSDQHGIGFEYVPDEYTEETHDQYVEELSNQLKKRFGNGLAGWDISSSYEQIK